jgi:hypothetical protein
VLCKSTVHCSMSFSTTRVRPEGPEKTEMSEDEEFVVTLEMTRTNAAHKKIKSDVCSSVRSVVSFVVLPLEFGR